jgi:hypothetical protein
MPGRPCGFCYEKALQSVLFFIFAVEFIAKLVGPGTIGNSFGEIRPAIKNLKKISSATKRKIQLDWSISLKP